MDHGVFIGKGDLRVVARLDNVINTNANKDNSIDFTSMALPVIEDMPYHTIRGNGAYMLIKLKESSTGCWRQMVPTHNNARKTA